MNIWILDEKAAPVEARESALRIYNYLTGINDISGIYRLQALCLKGYNNTNAHNSSGISINEVVLTSYCLGSMV